MELSLDSVFDFVDQKMDEEVFGDTVTPESNDFRIENDEEADRFLCSYQKHKNLIEENKKKAEAAKKRYNDMIDEWYESATSKAESANEYIMKCLNDYAERCNDGKTKTTFKLLHGNITYSKPKDKIKYYDEEGLVKWLKNNNMDDYIRITYSTDKNSLKKACEIKDKELYFKGQKIPYVGFEEQPMVLTMPDKTRYTQPQEPISFWDMPEGENIPF